MNATNESDSTKEAIMRNETQELSTGALVSRCVVGTIALALTFLFVACGEEEEARATPTPSPAAVRPSPTPEATRKVGTTATPTAQAPAAVAIETDAVRAAVLSAAPGYLEEEPSNDDRARTQSDFLKYLGEELRQTERLEFVDGGTIIVELADVRGEQPEVLADAVLWFQTGGGRAFADNFLEVFEEMGVAVTTKEELAWAHEFADGGWGFTGVIEGGGIGVDGEFIELDDMPMTVVIFARFNNMVRVSVLFDAQVDPLAIVNGIDGVIMQGHAQ
jgi:hypothetical protein